MAEPSGNPMLPGRILSERSHLTIPSLPNWIEPTVEFLRQKAILGGACDESRSGKLMLALHEAITNAVVHGNLGISSALKEEANSAFAEALARRASDPVFADREVDIVVEYAGDVCQWIITDQGDGFDVERVIARCTSDDPEILLASGRGILMMKSFLDDVRFEMGGRRVILSLERTSGKEKRRDNRVPVAAPFKVTPVRPDGSPDWAGTYEAMSRNFSMTGIALLQQQLAHSGQVLIGIQTEHGIVHVPAEVKHARPMGGSGMELGCHFVPTGPQPAVPTADLTPQAEEVQAAIYHLLERYETKQVPPDERRVFTRVAFNERIAVHLDHVAEPIIAYARDLSAGGMAFIAQQPLPEYVTIVFAASAEREALKVRSRVVRCSLIQQGFFDIGATFQRLG